MLQLFKRFTWQSPSKQDEPTLSEQTSARANLQAQIPSAAPVSEEMVPDSASPSVNRALEVIDAPKPIQPRKASRTTKITRAQMEQLVAENALSFIPPNKQIQAQLKLLKLILHPLPTAEVGRLMSHIFDQLAQERTLQQALHSIGSDNKQAWGHWILLQLTPKHIDEFEWQAQELAYSWGLKDDYTWTPEAEDTNPVQAIQTAIHHYREWLRSQHYLLLNLTAPQDKAAQMSFIILPQAWQEEFARYAKQQQLHYKT